MLQSLKEIEVNEAAGEAGMGMEDVWRDRVGCGSFRRGEQNVVRKGKLEMVNGRVVDCVQRRKRRAVTRWEDLTGV